MACFKILEYLSGEAEKSHEQAEIIFCAEVQ
jgi:hypothetical protein